MVADDVADLFGIGDLYTEGGGDVVDDVLGDGGQLLELGFLYGRLLGCLFGSAGLVNNTTEVKRRARNKFA